MQNYKKIAFILSTLVLVSITGYVAFAWTAPTAAPPGGNVPAPINVGTTAQTRQGVLQINADLIANRLLDTANTAWFIDSANTGIAGLFAGNVGIGTTSPGARLEVRGLRNSTVSTTTAVSKIGGGDVHLYTAAQNTSPWGVWMQVLSDANNPFPLVLNPRGGNVGIGTATPGAKLEVAGNIIAASPTANNHVATKWYVDASAGHRACYFIAAQQNLTCRPGFQTIVSTYGDGCAHTTGSAGQIPTAGFFIGPAYAINTALINTPHPWTWEGAEQITFLNRDNTTSTLTIPCLIWSDQTWVWQMINRPSTVALCCL